jgi:hypothetical protein
MVLAHCQGATPPGLRTQHVWLTPTAPHGRHVVLCSPGACCLPRQVALADQAPMQGLRGHADLSVVYRAVVVVEVAGQGESEGVGYGYRFRDSATAPALPSLLGAQGHTRMPGA